MTRTMFNWCVVPAKTAAAISRVSPGKRQSQALQPDDDTQHDIAIGVQKLDEMVQREELHSAVLGDRGRHVTRSDTMTERFDVVVVGGGHAGCEAAAAAARIGARTLLLTHRLETIGEMSCNPSIGGIGKGHLVREVDALDGLMGRAADAAGIHFKLLNRSKGPAVRGPRAQADRALYRRAMQRLLAETPGLTVRAGSVEDLEIGRDGRLAGVVCADGSTIRCGAAVLTTGTFLRGVIHIGEQQSAAGRVGEAPSIGLAHTLARLELPLGRLKTGTPPRLDRRTIDWDGLDADPGDAVPEPFSPLTERITNPQMECRITRTTPATHAIIRANLHRSAVYGGRIAGTGPRYCPSIEDKIVRFVDPREPQYLPRAGGTGRSTRSIPTASRPACRRRCSPPCWRRSRGWSMRG